MVKVFFGNYLAEPVKPNPDWRVLDVGCGFGNNLLPFVELGCECHGVELTSEILDVTRAAMKEKGGTIRLNVGMNRQLPYPDMYFDAVLSIGTLHYEDNVENVDSALREFRRVLKPGGVLFINTTGPEHELYKRALVLGGNRYMIQDFDFRNGETFFFFDNERYLEHYCRRHFARVETGRATEKLMTFTVDALIAVCRA